MKNKIYIGVLLLFMIIFTSCTNQNLASSKANVRFSNLSSDCVVIYGMKFGDAEYIGTLSPNMTTDYFETTPGEYSLFIRTSAGTWVQGFYGTATVKRSKKYSVIISGNISDSTLVWSINNE